MPHDPDRCLSTGRVARLCRVSPNAVRRAVDAGLIRAFRAPGSRHRQFHPAEVARFITENKLPFDPATGAYLETIR